MLLLISIEHSAVENREEKNINIKTKFGRRKGNKELSYAEAVTGNIVHGGQNIMSGQSHFNTSSNLRDNSSVGRYHLKQRISLKKICLQSTINGSQMKEVGGNIRDQI